MGDARKHNTLFFEHNPTDPTDKGISRKKVVIKDKDQRVKLKAEVKTKCTCVTIMEDYRKKELQN